MFVIGGKPKRKQHIGQIALGIRSHHHRKGYRRALLSYVEDWAVSHMITRLELHVVTANEPAIKLYNQRGFEIEGTIRNSLYIDGHYYDEYIMAKQLKQ
ncbi:GNAT family N-acetyltransferase [Pontibacillus halophilus]|nr:GNAT family N-acetyltransferase [Pontibacillus halophilus]